MPQDSRKEFSTLQFLNLKSHYRCVLDQSCKETCHSVKMFVLNEKIKPRVNFSSLLAFGFPVITFQTLKRYLYLTLPFYRRETKAQAKSHPKVKQLVSTDTKFEPSADQRVFSLKHCHIFNREYHKKELYQSMI